MPWMQIRPESRIHGIVTSGGVCALRPGIWSVVRACRGRRRRHVCYVPATAGVVTRPSARPRPLLRRVGQRADGAPRAEAASTDRPDAHCLGHGRRVLRCEVVALAGANDPWNEASGGVCGRSTALPRRASETVQRGSPGALRVVPCLVRWGGPRRPPPPPPPPRRPRAAPGPPYTPPPQRAR